MEWYTKEVLEILKMLNWGPKCLWNWDSDQCSIPCEHLNKGGGVLLNATSDKGTYSNVCDYFNGFCCAHWELIFGDYATYFECDVCRLVSWWGNKINCDQDRIDQKPIWNEVTNKILEIIKI